MANEDLSREDMLALAQANDISVPGNISNAKLEERLRSEGALDDTGTTANAPSGGAVAPDARRTPTGQAPGDPDQELTEGEKGEGDSVSSTAPATRQAAIEAIGVANTPVSVGADQNAVAATEKPPVDRPGTQPGPDNPSASAREGEDVSTEELMRFRELADRLLAERAIAVPQPQSAADIVRDLPVLHEHDVKVSDVASKAGVDEDRVLGITVRQAVNPDGSPFGDKWVTVIDTNGQKAYAKL